ncbi:AraC family ligand binding domain-containing protein, partial [Klebsiella pneumoniae]
EGHGLHVINGRPLYIQQGDVFYVQPGDVHYYDELGTLKLINVLINPLVG